MAPIERGIRDYQRGNPAFLPLLQWVMAHSSPRLHACLIQSTLWPWLRTILWPVHVVRRSIREKLMSAMGWALGGWLFLNLIIIVALLNRRSMPSVFASTRFGARRRPRMPIRSLSLSSRAQSRRYQFRWPLGSRQGRAGPAESGVRVCRQVSAWPPAVCTSF